MDQITHIYTDMELATLVDQYVRRFPQRRHLEKVYRLEAHLSSDMFARLLWLSLRDGVPIP
ncbi:MAG: hypothetical protein LKE39_12030 [Sphaerochaeta sp.]|jgi:hypothetical protein|nr:hypothetical protein [Sphaerochaeta sp.]MCI2045293.1 hypothetical protein [Sphaerochaeta sp.]MCI2097772.1 hypothetical protein [Sphaerochaeta sp.]MCI2104903.1 hypothetical protein [Sphaerochaeta sp.]MCI2128969.1 hypothetical protein [Sphaerochaeta sp.]